MINTKNSVTLKDKQKAKSTCKLFAIFAFFFLLVAVLLGIFTPRAFTLSGIGNNEDERIETFTQINEGDEYLIASKKYLEMYSMETNELESTTPYFDQISNLLKKNNELFNLSTFEDMTIHYETTGEKEGYLLVFDDDGDIFKFNYDNGNLVLQDNYWLSDRILIKDQLYKSKYKTRCLDVNGDDLYVLFDFNNRYVLTCFDLNNLKSGILKSKVFYTMSAPDKDQKVTYGRNVYIIDPIDTSKGENPYGIQIEGDYLYVLTSMGINRISLDFKDFENSSYINDGEKVLYDSLRETLLNLDDSDKTDLGITDSIINNCTNYEIEQLYKVKFGSESFVQKQNEASRKYASENDFIIKYDPTLKSETIVIKKDDIHADAKKNLAIKASQDQTIGGQAYADFKNKVYYLDLKSSNIFEINLSDFNDYTLDDNRTYGDKAIDTGINYSGASFYSIKGNISYDRGSKCLFLIFFSSRNISIIDISKEKAEIKSTFEMEYDIRNYIGNKDCSKIAALYQTEKRTLTNVASFPLHISVVNPDTYKNKTLFVVMMVIAIAFCVVSIIAFFIALKSTKREGTLLKLKVIKRDFKRNKWTYVALIPFVVLLIMFCYVEAVGSISFSFFSYTLQKPSYVWNTFGNYIEIFNDSRFWTMMGNTLFFLVFDLFLGIVPPIFFAFCLSIIKNKRLSGVLRALMFIPAIVPGIATLLIWKIGIFGDTGVLNQIICLFKTGSTQSADYTPINFLHDESISRWSLLLMGFPYVGGYLIFYGGLMNIPKEYDEACQLEGVGVIKRFFTIDLPLIKPQIKYILVMGILGSVQNYERTYMLGSTGTTTLVESMYRQMKDVANPNYGLASAYATLIFLMLLIPVLLNFRNTKKTTMGDSL